MFHWKSSQKCFLCHERNALPFLKGNCLLFIEYSMKFTSFDHQTKQECLPEVDFVYVWQEQPWC